MSNPTIGIKIANGSFFPVLDATAVGIRKRMVLTPARNDQDAIQVDLYRADDSTGVHALYLGSLVVENIVTDPGRNVDSILVVGIDRSGNLNATITDPKSGEYQSLSVSLLYLEDSGSAEDSVDEFDEGNLFIDEVPEMDDTLLAFDAFEADEDIDRVTNEAPDQWPNAFHPAGELDSAMNGRFAGTRGTVSMRTNVGLFIGYMILCLAILAIVLYLIFRALSASSLPGLDAGTGYLSGSQLVLSVRMIPHATASFLYSVA